MLPSRTVKCLLCGAIALMIGRVAAQSPARGDVDAFPTKQVRIVIPFSAGGVNDVLGRLLAQKLNERWKRPVIIENKPGAGSNIGMDMVAKAAPDGYTLLLVGSSYVLNPSLYKKLPFDPVKDFERVSIVATAPNILLVNKSFPARSVKELIAMAKASPGKLNYASSGIGASGHISMEVFKHMAGLQIEHIAFKGAPEAISALIAGEVQVYFTAPGSVAQHLKAGRVLPLGVTSLTRLTAYPDIPTISESGLGGYEVSSIFGVLAPGRTPKPLVDKLSSELAQVSKVPDARERILALSFEPIGSTPEEYTASVMADLDKYAKIVKLLGIEAE